VPYAALAQAFSLIEATTKRLEKYAILTAFLLLVIQRSAKGDSKSLLQTVYLCINRLSPDYVGIELGIGESLLIKAIAESTGRSLAVIKADLKKEGDLGLVAMVCLGPTIHGGNLIACPALEELPENSIQTKALDSAFRLLSAEGHCPDLWKLCRSHVLGSRMGLDSSLVSSKESWYHHQASRSVPGCRSKVYCAKSGRQTTYRKCRAFCARCTSARCRIG
jgi:DNA ligase N terminus